MDDLTGLGKLANSELVKRAYDDVVANPAHEVGGLATDILKAFRLFLAPLQLVAAYQDRLVQFLDRVRQGVPPERQQEASPSIAGPVMLAIQFSEDENPLTALYLNLLMRAIDKERASEAHPAFANIIGQLSPDEAMILFKIRDTPILGKTATRIHEESVDGLTARSREYFVAPDFPTDCLVYPENVQMYFTHLVSLNLIRIAHFQYEASPQIYGEYRQFLPTDFGLLFIGACIPNKWPTSPD